MSHACDSCGMPIESGHYCQYCDAERETIAYMSKMPAWKNHPEVVARLQA